MLRMIGARFCSIVLILVTGCWVTSHAMRVLPLEVDPWKTLVAGIYAAQGVTAEHLGRRVRVVNVDPCFHLCPCRCPQSP